MKVYLLINEQISLSEMYKNLIKIEDLRLLKFLVIFDLDRLSVHDIYIDFHTVPCTIVIYKYVPLSYLSSKNGERVDF